MKPHSKTDLAIKQITMSAVILAVVVSFFMLYRYTLWSVLTDPTEPITEKPTCDFVIKTNKTPFDITEYTAGEHTYEIITTLDGYIEVWKCE